MKPTKKLKNEAKNIDRPKKITEEAKTKLTDKEIGNVSGGLSHSKPRESRSIN